MAEIGSAFVTIAASAKGFGRSLTSQVDGDVKSAGTSIGRTFGKLFVLGAGVIAAAGIGSLLKGSIDEAREAQKVGAATEQIIKSTGGAAGITANQVGKMATRLSSVTGIDDEAIQSGSNLLLTFKNVKNYVDGQFTGTFDRATASAVDLSAAGFGSIESASKTLGKALNDPVKGVSALSRAGVTFSDQQKEQIKNFVETGDVAKAQNLILKEVEGQVGGVAAATATTGEKASVAFGNIKEAIGTALLPIIDTLGRQFLKLAPQIQKGIGNIGPLFQKARTFLQPFIAGIADTAAKLGSQLGPVLANVASVVATFVGQMRDGTGVGGQVVDIFGRVASVLGAVFGFISNNQAVVATFVGIIATAAVVAKAFAAAQLLVNLALAANPIGIVVVAVAALVAGLVYAYKNSETFRNAVNKLGQVFKTVFNGIKTVVSAVVGFIKDHWRTIIVILGGPIGVAVALVTKHFDRIKAGALAVIGWIKDHWPAIKAVVTGPFETAKTVIGKVWTAIRQGASFVKDVVVGVFRAISSAIQGAIDKAQTLLEKLHLISQEKGKGIKAGTGRIAADPVDPTGGTKRLGRVATSHLKVLGGVAGKVLSDAMLATLNGQSNAVADSLGKTADKVAKKLKEKLSKVRDSLSSLKSDFASLVEPIASNFTQGLFDFDTADAFKANLTNVKGTLTGLIGNFKKLLGEGLPSSFLYKLFEQGGPSLINSLAALPEADARAAASLFGDVTSLADQLGVGAATATKEGAQLLAEQKKQTELLAKLLDEAKKNPSRVAEATAQPSKRARRRAFVAA